MKPQSRAVALEWTVFKWSLMSAILLWTLVYKLSEHGIKVPDFVYVNF